MPHFTLDVHSSGPIVRAAFGVSEARRAALQAANQPLPNLFMAVAPLDTGASCTSVDPMVVAALGLSPTGSAQVITPSTGATPHPTSQYDVGLAIPGRDQTQTPLIVATLPVLAAELFQAQGFHALIGRDVLGLCALFYNGVEATFTLAY